MSIELYISICLFCAMFSVLWVKDLTDIDGLFWFIPKLYPYPETFLGKVLRCSLCLSGWLCFLFCTGLAFYYMCLLSFVLIIPSMVLTMTLSKIFAKL